MTHTRLARVRPTGIAASLRLFRPTPAVVVIGLLTASGIRAQPLPVSTPRGLLATDPATFVEQLEAARPAPVSALEKARSLAQLPEEGEITDLNATARLQLATIREVLRAADRDTVYDIKVISVPQAAIALYARVAVLVSAAALSRLRPAELQAAVAHEIGHEYVWGEYEEAKKSGDHRRLQELELMCDAIAVVMLRRVDVEVSALTMAIEKITRFNRGLFGTAVNEADYPTLAERSEFARAIAAWEKNREKPIKERK
jgi:hypothetical protein